GAFARAAEPVLQQLVDRKGIAVLAGGSGLYIDALIKGLDPLPASDIRLRARLMERIKEHGLADLLDELRKLDPLGWEKIDKHNPHRVIRALEVCLITGRSGTAQRTTPADRTDIDLVRIALEVPRTELYEKIDARVDHMIRSGLLEEVRALLRYRDLNSLRTVGYREMLDHLDGRSSLFETIDLIKQHTRNYAKRQLTWLRRDRSWNWVPPADLLKMVGLAQ
ncbi:MAG: tRNA (adenosine(37)-N6)-dimethylallyltransferase MiaA, partial [Bacteroidota bacterium]|nr:tRNA (adenosine(37)-N6)-dimethylallyltransferase MiaA [Bacteroidota bacterium]